MKMCQKHWDIIRLEIEKRGLSHLVAKNGEELQQRLNDHKNKFYDPLLIATGKIQMKALEEGGSYLIENNPETKKPYCALCEVDKHLKEGSQDWIKGCIDEIFNECLVLGLINKDY